MRKLLGFGILSLPFIGLFIFSTLKIGLLVTAGVFSSVLLSVVLIIVGVCLIVE